MVFGSRDRSPEGNAQLNKKRKNGATVSVRRNRDGTISMSSRGVGAPDLRKIAPALIRIVSPGPITERFAEHRHCDEYIEDASAPEPLRVWLEFARSPAHGLLLPRPHPRLFADYGDDRVRVTMASLMGDVGITRDFDAEVGYSERVGVHELTNFGVDP